MSWGHCEPGPTGSCQGYLAEKKNPSNFNRCPSHTPGSIPNGAKRKRREGQQRPAAVARWAVILARLAVEECPATRAACPSPTGGQQRQRHHRHRGEKTSSDSRSGRQGGGAAHGPTGRLASHPETGDRDRAQNRGGTRRESERAPLRGARK